MIGRGNLDPHDGAAGSRLRASRYAQGCPRTDRFGAWSSARGSDADEQTGENERPDAQDRGQHQPVASLPRARLGCDEGGKLARVEPHAVERVRERPAAGAFGSGLFVGPLAAFVVMLPRSPLGIGRIVGRHVDRV